MDSTPFIGRFLTTRNGYLYRTAVFSSWLLLTIPSFIISIWTTDENLRNQALVLLIVSTLLAYVLCSLENIAIIALLFGTHLLTTLLYLLCSPTPIHWNPVAVIAFCPIWIVLAMLGCLLAVIVLVAIIWLSNYLVRLTIGLLILYTPLIIHHLSLRQLIVRLPRYRVKQPFVESRLCNPCRRVLSNSNLLFGTWRLLARVEEWHPFHQTLEDVKRSWRGCPICEALLVPNPVLRGHLVQETPNIDYGTLSRSLTEVEDSNLFITVCLHKDSYFLHRFGLGFTIQLRTLDKAISKELIILEGDLTQQGEITETTGSEMVMKKINDWTETCLKHEDTCNSPTDTDSPTRLLSIGTVQRPHLRVVLQADHQVTDKPQYVALSHCWGGDLEFKLEQNNFDAMQQEVDFDSLPKNFQDAIIVTRKLGIPYIWIDSLCIIQDSSQDWAMESTRMGQVYKNAYLVISATASKSSRGGCFRQRTPRSAAHSLISTTNTRYYISSSGPSDMIPPIQTLFQTRVELAPLTKRAWAFQERLLSRRLVHFCSDVVLFECNNLRASELHDYAEQYDKEHYVILDGRVLDWIHEQVLNPLFSLAGYDQRNILQHSASRGIRGALDALQRLSIAANLANFGLREKIEFNRRWYELVHAYTAGSLTKPTDRLVAIAGIAAIIQSRAHSPYAAGIWRNIVPEFGLLWRVDGQIGPKEPQFCGPSWSWASVNCQVALHPQVDFANSKLKEEHIVFVANLERVLSQHHFHPVTELNSLLDYGMLEITGLLCKVYRPSKDSRQLSLSTTVDGIPFLNSWLLNFVRKAFFPEKFLTFFPDWTNDKIAISSTIEGGYETKPNEELYGLHIMTRYDSNSKTTLFGLILRPRLEFSVGGVQAFERIGMFSTVKWTPRDVLSHSVYWNRKTVHVL